MKRIFYFFSLSFILISCGLLPTSNKVCTCCDTTYTNIDSAIDCLSRTVDGKGTTADNRLLLIAFVDKDVEANQKLGWDIIKYPDVIKTAKRKYALVILDVSQHKTLYNKCDSYNAENFKKYEGKTFFVITNQALCIFGDWTFSDDRETIIERLNVGNGP